MLSYTDYYLKSISINCIYSAELKGHSYAMAVFSGEARGGTVSILQN
jgi:hypothetical protein